MQAAHLLVAAADFVLVPSRFEPCGLVAQAAVRYGAVPIVAPVGGLADLVVPGVRCMSPCRHRRWAASITWEVVGWLHHSSEQHGVG